MADQNNDLPEGTDKIIAGASGNSGAAGGGTAALAGQDDAMVTEVEVVGFVAEAGSTGGTGAATNEAKGPSSARAPGSSDTGAGVMDKLRSGGGKLSGQAADKARGFVSQGLERSAEALANVSRMIGDTAEGIDERLGQEYGDYARRAASTIENTANNLAEKDPEELIEDTRNFVRKSPGVALAGAAVVGFAVARLIKSGLSAGDGDDDDDRPNRSVGSNRA